MKIGKKTSTPKGKKPSLSETEQILLADKDKTKKEIDEFYIYLKNEGTPALNLAKKNNNLEIAKMIFRFTDYLYKHNYKAKNYDEKYEAFMKENSSVFDWIVEENFKAIEEN